LRRAHHLPAPMSLAWWARCALPTMLTAVILSSLHVIARSVSDEAIHSFFAQRDGLLRFARNDVVGIRLNFRTPDARQQSRGMICPSFAKGLPIRRGSRGCRVRAAPAVSRAKQCVTDAHEHTGSAETLRHPPRNGLTAYAVLTPATNSSCHRRCRLEAETIRSDRSSHRQLGTSNGCRVHTVLPYASAPFIWRARLAHGKPALRPIARPTLPRPPHPTLHRIPPRVRDDGQRPSWRDETTRLYC